MLKHFASQRFIKATFILILVGPSISSASQPSPEPILDFTKLQYCEGAQPIEVPEVLQGYFTRGANKSILIDEQGVVSTHSVLLHWAHLGEHQDIYTSEDYVKDGYCQRQSLKETNKHITIKANIEARFENKEASTFKRVFFEVRFNKKKNKYYAKEYFKGSGKIFGILPGGHFDIAFFRKYQKHED